MSSISRPGGIGTHLVKRQHHLPHWQMGGGTYFITFRSARGILPPLALEQVRQKVLQGHGHAYDFAFGVLMPDHAHLILRPLERQPSLWWDLASILKMIKGGSARRVNQVLGTRGTVWQHESFDRILRDGDEFLEKWRYIHENPFRAGLVDDPDDYAFFIEPGKLIGRTRREAKARHARLKSALPASSCCRSSNPWSKMRASL